VQQSGTMRSLIGQMSLFDELRWQDPGLSDRQVLTVACRRLVREKRLYPPINPEPLMKVRGIVDVVVDSTPGPWLGFLSQRKSGGSVIHVRAQDHPARRRFTVFHEIAHTLLPGYSGTQEFRCVENAKEEKEQLSNHAAAELLFPRLFFEGDLTWAGMTTKGLELLAHRYQASLEATAIHAVDNWGGPAMCVVAKQPPLTSTTIRTGERPALVVSYVHRQGAWPEAVNGYAILRSGVLEQTLADTRIDGTLTLNNGNQEQAARLRLSAKAYHRRAKAEPRHRATDSCLEPGGSSDHRSEYPPLS
jgi:hypothetical protein